MTESGGNQPSDQENRLKIKISEKGTLKKMKMVIQIQRVCYCETRKRTLRLRASFTLLPDPLRVHCLLTQLQNTKNQIFSLSCQRKSKWNTIAEQRPLQKPRLTSRRAIRERVLKQAEEALKGKVKSSGDEKLYKGIHGYTDYKAGFRRKQTVASEKAGGSHGPLRASAHIRPSARFDYQTDICKDYKETGYCGYGDSCKFMYDCGDYKSGWQMEKEWEEAEKVRKKNLAKGLNDGDDVVAGNSDDEDEDALPLACFICRQPFVDPVVTKCKHYFCEHCALKHHAKNKKCLVCNQPPLGIFNTAQEIKKRMAAAGK